MHPDHLSVSPSPPSDRIFLDDYLKEIWARKRLVGYTVLVTLLLAFGKLWTSPSLYTATYIVAPAQQDSSSGGDHGISSLLTGITGSSPSSVTPLNTYLQLLVSPRVAAKAIQEDPSILPTIFPAEWSNSQHKWHPPRSIPSLLRIAIFDIFAPPGWVPPSANKLSEYLQTHLSISPVGTTGMQQISFSFKSPQFAVKFLSRLGRIADATIRDQERTRADKQIAYLTHKLAGTHVADYRETLLQLISAQETFRMSINNQLPAAAMIVQAPFASDRPTSPNPITTIAVAFFGGIFLGIFLALAIGVWLPESEPRSLRDYAGTFWHWTRAMLRRPRNTHPVDGDYA